MATICVLVRRNSKSHKAGMCLERSRNSREVHKTGVGGMKVREIDSEVRAVIGMVASCKACRSL